MGLFLGIVLFVALPAAAAAWIAAAWAIEHRRDRVPILLYHRLVRKADADAGRIVDDERIWVAYDTVFAAQMDRLRAAGYTTLDFDDLVRVRREGGALPPKPVIVTFDDGYESNYSLAFPALRRNGQKATIFVAPEPDAHTREQVAGKDGFLSDAQMREMAGQGIAIQSHSLTHRILTELPDDEVRFELAESRRRLEAATGVPVRHLAIPRAGYDRRVRRIARELGYETVCCNNKGTANGLSHLHALPRIVVDRDMDPAELERCLEPRAGTVLRVTGNLKRIPERLGGARFARRVRDLLYRGPLAGAFTTRNLKRVIAVLALGYLCGGILFALRWLGA